MAFQLTKGRRKALEVAEGRAGLVAQQLRNEAVKNCPVDTGRLRQSIGVRTIGRGHYRVGTNVSYAALVEFGTRRTRAQPFLRPALQKVRRG